MKSAWNIFVGALLTTAAVIVYGGLSAGPAAAPVVAAAVPSPPPPPAPISVKLFGPREMLAGREFFFHVDTQGKTGVPQWRVKPADSNALTVFPDGTKARFRSDEPGVFVVSVAVGGENMTVAIDDLQVENLDVMEIPEVTDEPPPVAAPPPAAPVTATVANLALEAYVSAGRPPKAATVAGSITALCKRIENGLLPPDADVAHELLEHIDKSLGQDSGLWDPFVDSVDAILGQLKRQGNVTTIGSTVATLQEVAAVLGMQE